ncbi:uncharacterized protein I206_102087 [Kwoniella pini CBS 10737]|uniref:Uncharacterized protein n=1 Tax=Kwoniella pini CBS 10737 TaxID=1296096 RepID=A0A1B9HUV1_9TREE|nr:uncharacterized protein I206_06820 [Kwoniella pini CBS 10737]OCF47046.1 hypothetical protein I206_06820 [Kwoniella pini CBS 10737]
MSSTAMMSPQLNSSATILDPPPSTSRPQRSTRNSVNYSEKAPDYSSASPIISTPAAMSTRSRRSISSSLSAAERSPDKCAATSGRRRLPSPLFNDVNNVAALGLVFGDEISTEEDPVNELPVPAIEEGEDEVENGILDEADDLSPEEEEEMEELEELEKNDSVWLAILNKSKSPEVDSNAQSNTRVTRQRTLSPEKKALEEPAKKSIIRLVFGKKRKAEEDSDQTEREETPIDPVTTSETPAPEENKPDDVTDDLKEDRGRRLPRKKRKWLKKGEVDPDDPVAVARQKERHRLIDEAIDDLNKQEEMLLDNAHPQLLMLWEELERRRGLQLAWLEARQHATAEDLGRLRDHERSVAQSDFRVKREDLATALVAENRHKIARTAAERTALKRLPGSMPSLRNGRGGGGWPVSTAGLLSLGEQRLLPVTRGADPFERREISRKLQPLTSAEAKADLEKLEAVKNKRQHRSSTPPNGQLRHLVHQPHQSRAHSAHQRQGTNAPRDERSQQAMSIPKRQQPSQTPAYASPGLWDPSAYRRPPTSSAAPRPRSPEHLSRHPERPLPGYGHPRHEIPSLAYDIRHKPVNEQHKMSSSSSSFNSLPAKHHLPTPQSLGPPPRINAYDPFGRRNLGSGFGFPTFSNSPRV